MSVAVNGSNVMQELAVGERRTRVLIAAESSAAASRLHQLLQREDTVQVLRTVRRNRELVSAIAKDDADVVLWHAGAEPVEHAEMLAADLPVVVIVEGAEPSWVRQLLAGKVRCLLLGSPGKAELLAAIQSAAAGIVAISRGLTASLRPTAVADNQPSPDHLTAREQEVLEMMMEGLSNKEIAMCMNLSTHTVKFHISSVLGKLGASSRAEAVTIALRRGFVTI